MAQSYTDIWFGYYADQYREFHYTDNSTAYYTNWNPGEPNNSGGYEFCATVSRQHGRWNDANCDWPQPFVCSMWKSTSMTGTPPNPNNCPAGYTAVNSACFKVVTSTATQANALAACEADKAGTNFPTASLASIWDIHDNYYLKVLKKKKDLKDPL